MMLEARRRCSHDGPGTGRCGSDTCCFPWHISCPLETSTWITFTMSGGSDVSMDIFSCVFRLHGRPLKRSVKAWM